jgi:hypothetical protein
MQLRRAAAARAAGNLLSLENIPMSATLAKAMFSMAQLYNIQRTVGSKALNSKVRT